MTATEHLAHFVTQLDITAIPQAARDYAKLCVLDTLGIALAGHAEPSTRAARSVAQQQGGARHATLFVGAQKYPPPKLRWSMGPPRSVPTSPIPPYPVSSMPVRLRYRPPSPWVNPLALVGPKS